MLTQKVHTTKIESVFDIDGREKREGTSRSIIADLGAVGEDGPKCPFVVPVLPFFKTLRGGLLYRIVTDDNSGLATRKGHNSEVRNIYETVQGSKNTHVFRILSGFDMPYSRLKEKFETLPAADVYHFPNSPTIEIPVLNPVRSAQLWPAARPGPSSCTGSDLVTSDLYRCDLVNIWAADRKEIKHECPDPPLPAPRNG
ncbi:hypothetical protein RRG08_000044 [Elysia crispata]|uniref:Uncharacterized protein n=1 Tax=Elysia crispata TaxID=231223 RepID=A0AAE1CTC2_9GAST|nr:hypothetical protein RRG08_000044 [Elysia crispata]